MIKRLLVLVPLAIGCRTTGAARLADAASGDCRQGVSADSCAYYDCLEAKLRCGDDGYPKGFGARYCARFLGLCDGRLSSANARRWVRGTAQCLQQTLADLESSNPSCPVVTAVAFDSHPFCYTSGAAAITGVSFCTLNPFEWNQIRGCISFADTFSGRGLKQVASTAARCSLFFASSLFLDESGAAVEPDAATTRVIDDMTPAQRQARAKEFAEFARSIDPAAAP